MTESTDKKKVQTAFAVIIHEDGSIGAYPEVDLNLEQDRKATPQDIKYACDTVSNLVLREEIVATVAQRIINAQKAAAQAKAEVEAEEVSPTE